MSNEAARSWNEQIIEEFRANAGSVEQFGGKGLVLLHHTGAKSGAPYVSPLAGIALDDGAWAIVASNAGADNHPAWYHNVQVHPEVVLEVPGDDAVQSVTLAARVAGEDERDKYFAQMVDRAPQFADYEKKTSRRIPVVVLEPAA
jgi:deazaflavin-dependent oxidoreductase (nitroreductase family)